MPKTAFMFTTYRTRTVLTGIVQAGTVTFGDVPDWQNFAVAVAVVGATVVYGWVNLGNRLSGKPPLNGSEHG